MTNPAPGYRKNPDHQIRLEPSPRRVRVRFGGEWVADSTNMMLMLEARHLPVYYFPAADVRDDLLRPTDHATHCPYKGEASYWTIEAGGERADDAVWAYRSPYDEMAALGLQNYRAFYWDRVDCWYEEDEEIFVHPRDPYKRVDVLASSRPVRILLGGEIVAETARARFLFETGLPTRHYVPREDVRMELLAATDTATRCPYKGRARYWSVSVGGRTWKDIAWSYENPVPECPGIKDLVCFYAENVDAVLVDGKEIERPVTRWTR